MMEHTKFLPAIPCLVVIGPSVNGFSTAFAPRAVAALMESRQLKLNHHHQLPHGFLGQGTPRTLGRHLKQHTHN